MTWSCFELILFIGVMRSKPYFLPTSRRVCLLNEENLPDHGTMAPSSIDFVLSGINRSGSNSIFTPNPWHVLQAPNGELNENPLGSSSPIEIPQNGRSEEHTSELQSHVNLVCRLLLEKKKKYIIYK